VTAALSVRNLHARVGAVEILRGIDLDVPFGELHVIMGPNGSGKSTLCHVLMGRSDYEASGSARVAGEELLGRPVDERARLGLLQAFQYPTEVPGVTLRELLEELADAHGNGEAFNLRVDELAARLGMERFLDRPVNEGLSGGEKKRSEMLQLGVLAPRAMVLDEIDSGLDIDAVREVAEAVEQMRGPDAGILLITHYSRILRYLSPDRIHVMIGGRIVRSGGPELSAELEAQGYASFRAAAGVALLPAEEPG
jgi:Fe-S cluster assembly ATP-binding protein